MSGGRPRTAIGTYGAVYVMRKADRCVAETRFRDIDGRLRKVTATASSPTAAKALLKERLLNRSGYGSGGVLTLASRFGDLVELWLADLELQELAEGTKQSYRDQVRLHVLPAFEHFTLGEITTGRVDSFLKSQAAVSHSRARQSRTMLNLLFGFALRHDAMPRNPVEGTCALRKQKSQPQALTLAQIAAIRVAATNWRAEPGRPGPKPDGQVRDIIEVLLGTAMRTGEVLALRPCDIEDRPTGMVVAVTGTVVQRKGQGAVRQDRPKSDASIRRIPVPEFAAAVLRRRLTGVPPGRTIFANRSAGPLSPYNVRRTFREFLADAGLGDSGISLRWYRRTGATVIARGLGSDAAAVFLGHTSTAITEGHYIERDHTIDLTPAAHLERTLRPDSPDGALLILPPAVGEEEVLATVDGDPDVGDVA
ncbi:tyrosine-type recombinase/integrase [uncultured Nocardioides sp.]|uniref:tyrosine-type recombinase/integrase n=1 Tax=uncultured Nocardioides sp. TaxID=198441 RepID=UPI00260A9C62|nr:tyrosine-type recombinase/integrase [uncultured Nocardioides sp.]